MTICSLCNSLVVLGSRANGPAGDSEYHCLGVCNNYCILFFSFLVIMEDFLDAAASLLPTLRELKFTDYNLMDLGRCLASNGGRYQVLYGRDEVSM